MTMQHSVRHRSSVQRIGLMLVFAVFGVTILAVGTKVELENLARESSHLERRIQHLRRDRARLGATIVFKQKPGAIEQIAHGRLNMDYGSSRLSNLTAERGQGGIPE